MIDEPIEWIVLVIAVIAMIAITVAFWEDGETFGGPVLAPIGGIVVFFIVLLFGALFYLPGSGIRTTESKFSQLALVEGPYFVSCGENGKLRYKPKETGGEKPIDGYRKFNQTLTKRAEVKITKEVRVQKYFGVHLRTTTSLTYGFLLPEGTLKHC